MTAIDFSRRSDLAELMDDLNTDYNTYRDCLIDLAKANRWTLAHRPTLNFFKAVRSKVGWPKGRPLVVVDVGSGYGDLLRNVDRWARREGLPVRLAGIDLNPWSAQAASSATGPISDIDWVTANALEPGHAADVITCGLFTHHLPDHMIIDYLKHIEEYSTLGWFINDLHRHPFPYYAFSLLAKIMKWHRFVQHDGPVSVARAFTRRDWIGYVEAAGLRQSDVSISWRFPFRLCVSRLKGAR